ncbi:comm domain-containing protein 1-like [Plakobranchus ocellatus]|uniref:COMM domain-containing protein 1 n=1 Tax=Plakobranchus ocellatus TaxID=259542 RepID=A0AAV3YLC0_9GAST|nr:comm domain-containing protein 1-like [Plakobranchus ocellatus]
MADDPKCFAAFLNGISKQVYFGNTELTDNVLKEQIYPDISDDEFNRLKSRTSGLLRSLVSADMDMTQLEAFLTAQMKRKEGALSEQQAAALRKFWKANKVKIHDSIVLQTMWGNSLQKVSWRVDLQSQTRNTEQTNIPTAIMELHLSDNLDSSKASEVVRFELTESKLASVLHGMEEIEAQINKYTKK